MKTKVPEKQKSKNRSAKGQGKKSFIRPSKTTKRLNKINNELGIILKRLILGESDLLLTVFTMQGGKMDFFAKGAMKSIKRYGCSFDLFTHCRLFYTLPLKQDALNRVHSAEMRNPFGGIRESLEKVCLATYFCEMMIRLMEKNYASRELYFLLGKTFQSVSDAPEIPFDHYRIFFEIHFLKILGFLPESPGRLTEGALSVFKGFQELNCESLYNELSSVHAAENELSEIKRYLKNHIRDVFTKDPPRPPAFLME